MKSREQFWIYHWMWQWKWKWGEDLPILSKDEWERPRVKIHMNFGPIVRVKILKYTDDDD